jgi:hypothetical protein
VDPEGRLFCVLNTRSFQHPLQLVDSGSNAAFELGDAVDKDGNIADFSLTNSHREEFKEVNPVTIKDGCAAAKMMMKRMWGNSAVD